LATRGRVREGIGIIRAGEELAADAGLTALRLRAIISRTFFEIGSDENRALEGMREGLALARRVGDRRMMLRFINNVGFTAFETGDWDGGLAELEEGLADDLDPRDRVSLLGNALVVRAWRGESIDDGLAELERLIEGSSDPSLLTPLLDAQASAALAAGRHEEARHAWHRMIGIDSSQGPQYLYQTARAALWDGDREGAEADLAALNATGVHGLVVEARRITIRAGLAALEGRSPEAVATYRDAIRSWRDLGVAVHGALTALDMAILLGPSVPEVAPIAAAAREFFVRVGARPFIDRLDAALGGAPVAAEPSLAESVASPSP
jgi:tetratricopeptide (TPR) repeat protein